MVNGLVDFGHDDGVNFSVGGGIGWCEDEVSGSTSTPVSATTANIISTTSAAAFSKSKFAWQLLAEDALPGLAAGRYRPEVSLLQRRLDSDFTFRDDVGGCVRASAKFHTHSLLASLIYNFGAAAASATAAASAASAASGDADVPGRLGDPSDGHLPGAAAASAAASGDAGRTRPVRAD